MSLDDKRDYEVIARRFHEVYEKLAPLYHWETQPRSRVEWADLPAEQRGLMTETVKRVLTENTLLNPSVPSAIRDTSSSDWHEAMAEVSNLRRDLEAMQNAMMESKVLGVSQAVLDRINAALAKTRAPSSSERDIHTLMRLEGGAVIVPRDAWRWLMGESEDGFEPGPDSTKHPGTDRPAAYWWRSEFRRRCAFAASAKGPA